MAVTCPCNSRRRNPGNSCRHKSLDRWVGFEVQNVPDVGVHEGGKHNMPLCSLRGSNGLAGNRAEHKLRYPAAGPVYSA